jgi:hypothetical protein
MALTADQERKSFIAAMKAFILPFVALRKAGK